MPRAKRATRPIPTVTSRTVEYDINNYSAGMDSYTGNDTFPIKSGGVNRFRLAQDARIETAGEYVTRKGFDLLTPINGSVNSSGVFSSTGAGTQTFDENTWVATPVTATANGHICAMIGWIGNVSSLGTGTVQLELWSDGGTTPGEFITRSTLAASQITSSGSSARAWLPDAPDVVSGTKYWVVLNVQPSGNTGYAVSTTTTATTALVSTNSGSTWQSKSFAICAGFDIYTSTSPVKGLHIAEKSDGTKSYIFASGTSVFRLNNTNTISTIKSGLSSSATSYHFWTVNDTVYYCNGFDGLRKWDFSTESQVNTTNYTDLVGHKGLLFGVRADDPSRVDFSNFGLYETYTSTDFIYVPAPKSSDPVKSCKSINGYLLLRTLNSCYILSGDDNATFRLDAAPDQKGTYSPETSVSDKNFNYFLSDDGVYRSNGSQPELMSESIYRDIVNIANKSDCCMAINKGRLYLWFTSSTGSYNDSCYVWNLNYKNGADTVESLDTNAFVNRAVSSFQDDDTLVVGSSRIGTIYWQELDTNDSSNVGADLNFELQLHYLTGSSPSIYKQIRYWEPRFGASDDNFVVACDFAYDLRDNWQTRYYQDVQGIGSIWGDSSMVWGQFTWGATKEKQAQLYVPGEYRRIALRYKHTAARQPVHFLGHTIRMQERRMR